jgi:hypothetical protein
MGFLDTSFAHRRALQKLLAAMFECLDPVPRKAYRRRTGRHTPMAERRKVRFVVIDSLAPFWRADQRRPPAKDARLFILKPADWHPATAGLAMIGRERMGRRTPLWTDRRRDAVPERRRDDPRLGRGWAGRRMTGAEEAPSESQVRSGGPLTPREGGRFAFLRHDRTRLHDNHELKCALICAAI